MSSKISLYQALKQSGLFSSKDAIVQAINNGKVTVDGIVTTAVKFQFSPKKRIVCVDGKPLTFVSKKYIVLNKPAGYSCQKNDNFPYVVSLLPFDDSIRNSLFSIGRLDVPTTGLLIITNDGNLSAQLAEPQRRITKTYRALLKNKIIDEDIKKLEQGVFILIEGEKYKTLPAIVKKISENLIEISITEGKYRQIRKMLETVGNKVVALERITIGNLLLGNLSQGKFIEYGYEDLQKKIFGI